MPFELNNTFEIDRLIIRYLDNEVMTDEEILQLKEWIHNSKDNEGYFRDFVLTWEVANIYIKDISYAQVKLDEFNKKQKLNKTRKIIKWSTSSAAAIVLLLICVQLFSHYQVLGDKELTFTTDDTKKEVVLPDGSHVWLNAQSSITYSKNFKRSRNVKLTGEALFDVVKSEGKNFIVETSNVTIEVLGTVFLVNEREESDITETVLETGLVNITINNTGKDFNLNPDELFVFNRVNGTTSVETVNASSYTGWIEADLSFTNIPLNELLIQLEKWYSIEIICDNNTILNIPVSITVDEEPLDEILFLLSQIVPLSWYVDNYNRIILN